MRTNTLLMQISFALSDLPDRPAYLDAARQIIGNVLPGDDVFWTEGNFARKTSQVWHGPHGSLDIGLGVSMGRAGDHPVMASYFANLSDLTPRRISDVCSGGQWRHTDAHALLNTTVGRHQLSVATALTRQQEGRAWVIGRRTDDFTDTELELAVDVQPVFTALDRMYLRQTSASPAQIIGMELEQERARLTAREVDVLTLVADGLTAQAVAIVRRISTGTVRKHLQNAYAKLGFSDRLLAVDEARRRGILPVPAKYPSRRDNPTSRADPVAPAHKPRQLA